MGKGSGKSSFNKIIDQDQQEVASGKQNMRAACQNARTSWKTSFFWALLKHRM